MACPRFRYSLRSALYGAGQYAHIGDGPCLCLPPRSAPPGSCLAFACLVCDPGEVMIPGSTGEELQHRTACKHTGMP